MTRIAVVGGGPSGLAAAESLTRRGAEVVVLEASDATGGKVASDVESGFVFERGPHGFLGREPKVFELIERLGLTSELVRADTHSARRYLVRAGALVEVPETPPAFLRSEIVSWGAKVRMAAEPFLPADAPQRESVWAFAKRRLGTEAADFLVDAIVTGIYGGDPKALSVNSAFPRMRELERDYGSIIRAQFALAKERRDEDPDTKARRTSLHSFRLGLQQLTDALTERAGRVLLGHEVRSLARTSGGEWELRGPFGELKADAVVLTGPAFVTASLIGSLAPGPAERAGAVPYAPISVVMQTFRAADARRRLDAFGFLAPNIENRNVLGCIWASSVFPGHAPHGLISFRSLLGGVRHPERSEGTDEELFARARVELDALCGMQPDARPVEQRVVRWPRGIPQYDLDHAGAVEAADEAERMLPGLFISGNGYRGVALLDCLAGAEALAERVLARLPVQGARA